jgi:hypothetical protein
MVIPASLMLARSFKVDGYGMGFGIADILYRVCSRLTPNSPSSGSSFLFGSAIWITKLQFGTTEDIYHARGVRMHWLLFPRFQAVFEDAHLIVFQQVLCNIVAMFSPDLVRGPLCIRRRGVTLE